jgi:hypothetical protein
LAALTVTTIIIVCDDIVWTSLTRRQSGVCSVQPSGYRFLICDQKRRNPSLDCLKNAIPCSLALFDRSVQRDAEIRTRFDQFSVPGRDCRRSGLWPFCQPNIDVNAEALACLVERLVDVLAFVELCERSVRCVTPPAAAVLMRWAGRGTLTARGVRV